MSLLAVEAVVFDYDGLLVDTEEAWFRACQQVCARYDVAITEEHRLELMRSQLSAYLVERFGLPVAADALRPVLYGVVNDTLRGGIPLMPGAVHALEVLGKRYSLAIGTGSRTHQVEAGLARLSLRNRFAAVVASDQVEHGKPEPDIYLKVSANLGVAPETCVVFEDQPKGIQAAKAAGMLCIAVSNKYLPQADYSQADRIIPSLGAVSLELIQAIEGGSQH